MDLDNKGAMSAASEDVAWFCTCHSLPGDYSTLRRYLERHLPSVGPRTNQRRPRIRIVVEKPCPSDVQR